MSITLGTGNDTFYIYENFLGGTSNQTLGDVNLETIDGGAGRDTVMLGDTYPNPNFTLTVSTAGVVTLTAASGHTTFQNFEILRYSNNVVLAVGSAGNDVVAGGSGNDPGLYGLDGNDRLDGGAGNDVMLGGAGNDTYVVDSALDSVQETTTKYGSIDAGGVDTVQSVIAYTLGNFVEKLLLRGTAAIAGAGNALANTLGGNEAANLLAGNDGNDTLAGAGGNDTLAGGAGKDVLIGGAGSDLLEGGASTDTFRFATAPGAGNMDTIADWRAGGAVDRIQLDDDVFTALGPASATRALDPAQFFMGPAAHDADDRIVYHRATGALYYDADGTGPIGQVQFAQIGTTGHPALSAGVFQVIT